jgi:hypothetical protein
LHPDAEIASPPLSPERAWTISPSEATTSASVRPLLTDGVTDGSAGELTSPLAPSGLPGAMVSVVP